ncbi:hypothetical protein [Enterovirga sp. CN4-39]|uniref:hypothetical protein n=1 Tax=Enterovirga sp. CN4-39 TaxID=3400910 RepID=UPI003C0357AE
MRTEPPAQQPGLPGILRDVDDVHFRLWVLTDLPLDGRSDLLPEEAPPCDAIVVAGSSGAAGLAGSVRQLAATFDRLRGTRVLAFVPGAAAFADGAPLDQAVAEASEVAERLGIALLHDTTVRIAGPHGIGLNLLGAVLWPSFQAAGRREARHARQHARHRWRVLKHFRANGIPFAPHDAVGAHHRSRAFIQDALTSISLGEGGFGNESRSLVPHARPGDKAVVLTGFPPSPLCLPRCIWRESVDPLSAAWLTSDMDEDLSAPWAPAAWVHGSVPVGFDFRIGRTRVLSNPLDPAHPANGGEPARIIVV